MTWIKSNWKIITGIGVLLIFLIISYTILINSNSTLKFKEKLAKEEIDSLHKENKNLLKELKLTKDSIQIFHDLAILHENKDTIYLKQIKYLQNKTNEEITHYNSLPIDSQYRIFTELAEEYIKTGFNPDK